MAEGQSPESISSEAHERVKRENEALKALTSDLKLEKQLAAHYGSKGIGNAFDVAQMALPQLRQVPLEELGAKADEWFEQQRRLFAPATPKPEEPVVVKESQPSSPWETAAPVPIPTGGRVQGTGEPLVTGSPAFVQWAKGKTLGDVQAAINSGDVVVPDKVKQAQNTIF